MGDLMRDRLSVRPSKTSRGIIRASSLPQGEPALSISKQ
jgi:hypothetical protein